MNKKPFVSIIVPVFNAEKFIEATLRSIMNQTYDNFEIIAIDDGSTDRTLEILNRYNFKVKVFQQKNAGPATARNRGILESKGKLLAFCDSDDIWEPNKLELQVDVFEKNKNCGLVGTNGIVIDAEGSFLNKYISDRWSNRETLCLLSLADLLDYMALYPSTVMLSKEAIIKSGVLFDGLTYYFENVQMFFRITKFFEVYFLNRNLVQRRYLRDSLSHANTKKDRYAQIKVYNMALLDFPEYKRLINRNLIHSSYSASRLEAQEGAFNKACILLLGIFMVDLFFGRFYWKKSDNAFIKFRKIFSPFYILSLFILKKCPKIREW